MKRSIKFIFLALAMALLVACSNGSDTSQDNTSESEDTNQVAESSSQEEETQEVEEEKEDTSQDEKPIVYTTLLSVSDFAKRIAGDKIEVVNLMEGVADAHHWEPTPTDISNINASDALIINGAGFEFWVDSVKDSLDDDVPIVDTSEGVDLLPSDGHSHDHSHDHGEEGHDHAYEGEEGHDHDHDHSHEEDHDHSHEEHDHDHDHGHDHSHDHGHHDHDHGEFDPHYWVNPEAAAKQAENIYEAFVEIDPDNQEYYKENLDQVHQELETLNKEYDEALEEHAGKGLIVPHKAFTYMTEEYDLVQISIEGLLADGDPSPQRMGEIVKQAEEQGIQAVFYDPYQSPKASEQIADELGVGTLPLHTLESISEEDKENGEDYFSLMRKNLDSILQSFGE